MKKNLLIVESPAKAVTLKKYLGPDFDVKASVGHVMDLPKSSLGVEVADDFRVSYEVIKGKEKVIKDLKKAAQKAQEIYLAPDPDREGEAIAWHIAEQIEAKDKPLYRVLFHELTRKGVEEAMKSPTSLDKSKYESQQARRILDRLVGYQISPILWTKVKTGLSAGRVQSVTVRLVVERERAIQRFEPQEYWTISALLESKEPPAFEANLLKHRNKTLKIGDEKQARSIVSDLKNATYVVSAISRKKRNRAPEPPFKTSTLQQEAVRKLRFTAKKTMAVAQMLYEGIEIGDEGQMGLITYMRTDSIRIANDAQQEALNYILDKFGPDYRPSRPNMYKNQKNAQDAHEGIRPTSIYRDPESVKGFLTKDQYVLYKLIWERFLASQMNAAVYDMTSVDITAGDYLLRATGSILIFAGFMAVYVEGLDDEKQDEDSNGKKDAEKRVGAESGAKLPPSLEEGETLKLQNLDPRQHFTKPPPRYTEATLVKELEEKGIGRPSTYAAILSNIIDRGYVIKDKRVLFPSELGYIVNDLLVGSFPDILDVTFTANMEEQLDGIEEGKNSSTAILKDFYEPFSNDLKRADKEMPSGIETEVVCEKCGLPMSVKYGKNGPFLACTGYPKCKNTKDYERDEKGGIHVMELGATDEMCPKCGSPLTIKKGRFGPFLACTGYPDCKFTKPLDGEEQKTEKVEPEITDELCDKCGGHMMIRLSRSGSKFMSCENYPKCKNTRSIGIGVSCPLEGCDGEITERASRKGRRFYGCTKYPKCKFVSWYEPVNKPCPECGSSYLIKKDTKRDGLHIACPEKGCSYKEPLSLE